MAQLVTKWPNEAEMPKIPVALEVGSGVGWKMAPKGSHILVSGACEGYRIWGGKGFL